MPALNSTIVLQMERRPCIVNGEKCLFHGWEDRAFVFNPIGAGQIGGQTRIIYGLIENSNGEVFRIHPEQICFCDNEVNRYFAEHLTLEGE